MEQDREWLTAKLRCERVRDVADDVCVGTIIPIVASREVRGHWCDSACVNCGVVSPVQIVRLCNGIRVELSAGSTPPPI